MKNIIVISLFLLLISSFGLFIYVYKIEKLENTDIDQNIVYAFINEKLPFSYIYYLRKLNEIHNTNDKYIDKNYYNKLIQYLTKK